MLETSMVWCWCEYRQESGNTLGGSNSHFSQRKREKWGTRFFLVSFNERQGPRPNLAKWGSLERGIPLDRVEHWESRSCVHVANFIQDTDHFGDGDGVIGFHLNDLIRLAHQSLQRARKFGPCYGRTV